MKKHLLLILTILLFGSHAVWAQYYTLRVAGGYAWPGLLNSEGIIVPKIDPYSPEKDGLTPMANIIDSVILDGSGLPKTINDKYKQTKGSYGKGMHFSFGFGYMINPYVGVELGVSYLQSATISCYQKRNLTLKISDGPPPIYNSIGDYYLEARINTRAVGLSLMPSIIVQGAKPGWKVYPYGRFGISLPVWGALTHDISIDVNNDTAAGAVKSDPYFLGKHTDVTLKTEGAISIGVNGAIGVAYRPLPFLQVNAEINGQYLVTRAKSAKIIKWESDGVDRISERGVYRTEFNFTDDLNQNSNNADYNANYDKTKPKDDVRPTGPFSNLGFSVGVSFLLSKQILQKDNPSK